MDRIDQESLKAKLRGRRGQFSDIAKRARMSKSWLSKFANDCISNPTVNSLRKLRAALES